MTMKFRTLTLILSIPCGQRRVAHLEEDDPEAVEVHLLVVGCQAAHTKLGRHVHHGPDLARHVLLHRDVRVDVPVKMPPPTKSWFGVYQDRGVILTTGQTCLSLNPSPQSLHIVQLFGRHSWLKTRPKQAEWAQMAYETELSWCLPGVRPSHHPFLHCPHSEDDFCLLQCLILTFLAWDIVSQRLKTAILVTVAAQYGPLCGQKVSKW